MTSSIDAALLQHSQCKSLQDLIESGSTAASRLDAADELKEFRSKFYMPTIAEPEAHSHKVVENGTVASSTQDQKSASTDSNSIVYLCGNSLGLQPKLANEYINEEMKKWQQFGVEGHFKGKRPWLTIDEKCNDLLAQHIIGAQSQSEISTMNSLSINLHLLLTSFYQPTNERYMIIVEEAAFCSDQHILRSQITLHGRQVSDDTLLQLKPRQGESYLRNEDILAEISKVASKVAVVLLPGVQYYSGQFFDIQYLTREIKQLDSQIYVGWDLAHAVGNVPLSLHADQVDFAVWCSYKYLNSGPGAIGGAFVHSKHAEDSKLNSKKLCGWWGQTPADRFKFGCNF
jgi:kynureninase